MSLLPGDTSAVTPKGLAAERTLLAWRRTALGAAALAALSLHYAASRGWGPHAVPSVLAVLTALLTALLARWRRKSLAGSRDASGNACVAILALAVSASTVSAAVVEIWAR